MSEPIDLKLKVKKYIPARTDIYEIAWYKKDFCVMTPKYREIRERARNKMTSCWWCKKQILDDEKMSLVCIDGKGNKIFCSKCISIIEDADERKER